MLGLSKGSVETAKLLLLSEKRRRVVLLLREGERTLGEINEQLDSVSSAVIPQLRKLEEAGLIERRGQDYGLTAKGKLAARSLEAHLKHLDLVNTEEQFWETHDVEAIPESFHYRLHELHGGKVVRGNSVDVFQPHTNFMEELSRSRWVKGVSSIFHPDYPETFTEMAKSGLPVSLIVTPGVLDKLRDHLGESFEQTCQSFLSCDNTEFLLCDREPKMAFTVTDRFLSLGLHDESGIYDPTSELFCSEKPAIRWGKDLFDHYRKISKKPGALL